MLPLRNKILFGYGIALFLIIVVLAWAVMNILKLGKASDAILRENYKSTLAAGNMLIALERQEKDAMLLPYRREEEIFPEGSPNYTVHNLGSDFHANESEFLQWLGRARDNVTIPGEELIVSAIDSSYTSFLAAVSELRTISRGSPNYALKSPRLVQRTSPGAYNLGSDDTPLRAVAYYRETLVPAYISVRDACIRLRAVNQDIMYRASSTARTVAVRAVVSTLLLGLATVLFGLIFSSVLSNVITRPIAHLMNAARKISEGNYDVRVSTHSSDELGLLAGEFNTMAGKLKSFHDLNIGSIIAEKNKSEAIIRSIDDGLLFTDTEHRIVDMNPAAARILGTTPLDAEGKHFLEIVRSEELFGYIKRAQETGLPVTPGEDRNVYVLDCGENRHYYQFSIMPVHAGSESVFGVLLLLRDVTRLKELDILKSQFVMTASHELRTPLTGALMSIDLLMESTADTLSEKERLLLTAARDELHRLRTLVNDILELSRIESGKIEMLFESVAVRGLVENAVAVLNPQAEEKGIELSFTIPEDLPPVKADPNKTVWVLTNLLSNALRHTHPGGFVRVSAEALGSQVHLSVRDNGTGIPYELQSRIFDKFVQVRDSRENGGSGLGLSIAREIVRAHGGTIWVDSAPGEGSTFTFTLPAAAAREKNT